MTPVVSFQRQSSIPVEVQSSKNTCGTEFSSGGMEI